MRYEITTCESLACECWFANFVEHDDPHERSMTYLIARESTEAAAVATLRRGVEADNAARLAAFPQPQEEVSDVPAMH